MIENTPTHWQIDKSINVGHLLVTLSMFGSVMWWGNSVEQRLTELQTQQVVAERSEVRDYEWKLRIETKIDRISNEIRAAGE